MKSVIKRIPFDLEKAKAGAKIVTRNGLSVRICAYDAVSDYPIIALIELPESKKEVVFSFTKEGTSFKIKDQESKFDLFIEKEVEEDDSDYDPYKATVESIADMVERYSELQSIEELKDFYNNVRVECQDAFDYGRVCEKQDEEVPADNKPKFQKGNWVIDKQGTVHQIANIIENVTNHTYGYDTISYSFGILSYGYFNDNVKDIRLWNIEDAKDGDVLACYDCIVLFKEIDGLNIKCHCAYHYMNTPMFFVDTLQNKRAFYPATKEECDLLFQKIKEEGYEWDPDKKELHKIEEIKNRRMTNQELADWLCQCPEECREFKYETCSTVLKVHVYYEEKANDPAEYILIRKNHGEWEEPLIKI